MQEYLEAEGETKVSIEVEMPSQGKTQVEIAEMFGISRQRVQQILESVFKKEGKSYLNRTSLTTRLMDIHSLEEAAIWAETHKEEFNLEKTPNAEVLKAAAQDGRLVAIKKGSVWLTSTHEIKIYLTNFHPGRGGHRRVKL
jgi:DNA-binding transcriptional regulator LsrR (DeoR family)